MAAHGSGGDGRDSLHVLRVFEIERRANGKVYRYARVTLEGSPLTDIGVAPGDTVAVEFRDGIVRIRQVTDCAVRGCRQRHFRRGLCRKHDRQRRVGPRSRQPAAGGPRRARPERTRRRGRVAALPSSAGSGADGS